MKKRIGSVLLTLAMACLCVVALGGEARAAEHNHTDWTAWTATDNLPTTSGSYYLTENVTLSSTWSVPTGTTNLCLNGKSITLTADAGSVIKIDSGATLNLYDEGTDTHVINDSTTITGGVITGGKGTKDTSYYGGGVYIHGSNNNSRGTLNMYGGTIAGNRATYGGGVYLGSVGATFTMYGGTISGNTANGGGKGAGVYLESGTMTVSGTAKVKDNTDGATKGNVYLYNVKLNIESSGLTEGAEIWVTTYIKPGNNNVENPYPITSGTSTSQYKDYFHSDITSYQIEAMDNNKVGLAYRCSITFDANGGTGTMGAQSFYGNFYGKEVTLNGNAFTRTGYTFAGWTTNSDGSGERYSDGATVTMYGNTTLYAQWTPEAATPPTVTVGQSSVSTTYGESVTLSVTATPAEGHTITKYEWYRSATNEFTTAQLQEETESSETSNSYTHSASLGAGIYYYWCEVTVKRDDNDQTATARSEVITATVTKADPTYTAPTGLTATTGQTLADVTLPSGWEWDAPSTSVGNETGEHSFSATYTPSDTINYKTATANLSVNVVAPHVHNDVAGVTFMPWNGTTSLPTEPGNYYLTKNVTLSAAWAVPTGETNLCLDGHSITRNGNSAVVTINNRGATLNLYDEEGDAGTITHSSGTGRGVEVRYGTFNMYGGKITGNTINGSNGGGGVFIVYSGKFTMTGGEISGNTATVSMGTSMGGGVSLFSGTFRMEGGEIKGNTATTYSAGTANGGGVYIEGSDGKFTMTGGEITGNTAKSSGGGVYVNKGQFEISGNPIISGNKTSSGSNSNLYIYNPYGKLVIGGKLDDEVKSQKIGVNAREYAYAFTSGWTTKMGEDADPANYFISERDGYQIYLVGEEARLTYQRTFTFAANGGSGTMAAQTVLRGLPFTFPENGFTPPDGKSFKAWQIDSKEYQPGADEQFYGKTDTTFTVNALWGYAVTFSAGDGSTVVESGGTVTKPDDPTKSGYTFGGWYKDADLTEAWNFETDTVNGATTLYAKWTANPAPPSGSYDYTPSTPTAVTVTVPVSSGGSTVSLTARVTNGGEATLTSANVSAALDGDNSTGAVAIDLGGLTRDVKSVAIPAAIVADVAGAVASADNATDSLTVRLTDGSVTFDAAAVESISEQSGGNDLKLNLDGVETNTMNGAQQSAVAGLEVAGVLDVYMTSNNVRISDFDGGSAEVRIPFTAPNGRTAAEYAVWYVAEDGAMTNQRARYDAEDACFVFTVTHFSNYVIAYGGCPQNETCPIAAYADADPAAWYHDGVHWAVESGVMSGWEDAVTGRRVFAPDGDTSRAMVAVMLWRLEGEPSADAALIFDDVQAGKWYSDAIRWAAGVGIITGWDDAVTGRPVFAPDDAVTREQLATMLWRYAKYKGADVSVGEDTNILSYGDAFDVSEYAIPAMQWACGSGVVGGYDDLTGARILAPRSSSSRAVVATMMRRFVEWSGDVS